MKHKCWRTLETFEIFEVFHEMNACARKLDLETLRLRHLRRNPEVRKERLYESIFAPKLSQVSQCINITLRAVGLYESHQINARDRSRSRNRMSIRAVNRQPGSRAGGM